MGPWKLANGKCPAPQPEMAATETRSRWETRCIPVLSQEDSAAHMSDQHPSEKSAAFAGRLRQLEERNALLEKVIDL